MLHESSCTDIVLKAILKGKYEIKQFYPMKIARGPLSVEITQGELKNTIYLYEEAIWPEQ